MSHRIDRRHALRCLGALGMGGTLAPAMLGTMLQDGREPGRSVDPGGGADAPTACGLALAQWSMRRNLLQGKIGSEAFDTAAFVARTRDWFKIGAVELSSLLLGAELKDSEASRPSGAATKKDEAKKDANKKDEARKDANKKDESKKDSTKKDGTGTSPSPQSEVIRKIREVANAKEVKLLRLSIDSENSAVLDTARYRVWIDRAAALGCEQVGLAADSTGSYDTQREAAILWVNELYDYIAEKNYRMEILLETRRSLSTNGRWLASIIRALREVHGRKGCGALLNFGRLDYDPLGAMKDLSKWIGGIVAEFNGFVGVGDALRERDIDYAKYLADRPCPGGLVTIRYVGSEDERTRIGGAIGVLSRIYGLKSPGNG
jgi:hypothetical protein